MAVLPPPQMSADAWDYLLRFTLEHEWMVLHMYNNKATEDAKQDVTCGIGHLLSSPEAAVAAKGLFYDPATGQTPSDQQMRDDWLAASRILRTRSNLETDYANACKMRMSRDKAIDDMAGVLKSKLKSSLGACPELASFSEMPAQAQVGAASYNYGYLIQVTVHFRAALGDWDFDEAAKQSFLRGISSRKLLGHRTLFWNAARIVEQRLDYGLLPQSVNPPELIPWQAWSETVIDADGGPDTTISHGVEPRRPTTAR
jgi:hypothetical protein